MILCDTNILTEIYRGNNEIIKTFKGIGQGSVAVSYVTCAELFYGARNKRELQIIQKDLNKLTILPIKTDISTMAVELVAKFALSHKISLPDALIAATAIFQNIELYTLNRKDFKFIDNIRLFDSNFQT